MIREYCGHPRAELVARHAASAVAPLEVNARPRDGRRLHSGRLKRKRDRGDHVSSNLRRVRRTGRVHGPESIAGLADWRSIRFATGAILGRRVLARMTAVGVAHLGPTSSTLSGALVIRPAGHGSVMEAPAVVIASRSGLQN
jgi:hypothetical protein